MLSIIAVLLHFQAIQFIYFTSIVHYIPSTMASVPSGDYNFDDFDLGDFADLWPMNNETFDFDSFEESYYCKVCGQIELGLRQALPPILLLIGLPGNLLCFMSMLKLSTEAFPLCAYLCFVACIDSTLLIIEMGNDWIHFLTQNNIVGSLTTHSDAMCKMYNFTHSLLAQHNAWILIAFAIECSVLLLCPRKIRSLSSGRVGDTLAFISVILICANCHYFWTHGINKVEIPSFSGKTKTMPFCQFQTWTLDGQLLPGTPEMGVLWTSLEKVLSRILPGSIFILILMIYLYGRHRYTDRQQLEDTLQGFIEERYKINMENLMNGRPYERTGAKLDTAFTTETLWRVSPAMCIMFLVCHGPEYIHESLEQRFGERGSPDLWALTGLILHMARSLFLSCKLPILLASSAVFRKTTRQYLFSKVGKFPKCKNKNCDQRKKSNTYRNVQYSQCV